MPELYLEGHTLEQISEAIRFGIGSGLAEQPTLRDRFAMAAPPVPETFPRQGFPQPNRVSSTCKKHTLDDEEYGANDGCGECARARGEWEAREIECRRRRSENELRRECEWRYAFADAMLEARKVKP